MAARSLLVALLLSNVFWLAIFITYTQFQPKISSFKAQEIDLEQLCPRCDPRDSEDGQATIWSSGDETPPSREAEYVDNRLPPEELIGCSSPSGSAPAPDREIRSWSESWYNNNLLELPSAVHLPRLSGPSGEQYPLATDEDVCNGAESEVVAYGFNAAAPSVIGILWPRNSRYRLLILNQQLVGMAVVNGRGDAVAHVAGVEKSDVPDGNVNLVLRFATDTAAGCDALIMVIEQPYPVWVLDFSFGFTATFDQRSRDSTEQHIVNLGVTLRRQRVHDYNIVHIFNPYTPRQGSHQEMELTVVQRSLEVAYNRAWERGIKVLILAAVFEEDEAMIHYPYQKPSRYLNRYFLDQMGRRIPLMDDILNLLWEDGPTNDTYIFTNADIAVIPDFFIDCWSIYRSDEAVPVLLREQLPLDQINLTPPVNMQHLYDATADIGVKHTGDDCFLFPASLLAGLDYGMVFPAYPPFACFLMQKLGFTEGGRYRLRSRSTFHLGVDTETSVWLNNPEASIGRHTNNLNALAALDSEENADALALFIDKCRILSWQMDRASSMLPVQFSLKNPPQVLPSGVPGWYLGALFPSFGYGRITYAQTKAILDRTRANTSIYSKELKEIMGAQFLNLAAEALRNGAVQYPSVSHGLASANGWPPDGFTLMTAEERVNEIRKLSADHLWSGLPAESHVVDEWMAEMGLKLPSGVAGIEGARDSPPFGQRHPDIAGKSASELVELLQVRSGWGGQLRLVECITTGMTGIPLLFDLLSQSEAVGGARELEPKMIGSYLTDVLTQPLERTFEKRQTAKLVSLLSRWVETEKAIFMDLNNMFVKTYADVVLASPIVSMCREQVRSGAEPSILLDVVILRRPLLELVWKQTQRGWFNDRSHTNQRGVWYYALKDISEPSYAVIPFVETLPSSAPAIRKEIHSIIGYNLDIEERSRRFAAEHADDPCVLVHEVYLGDLASKAGCSALLTELGAVSALSGWDAESRHRAFLSEEDSQNAFVISKSLVEEEVVSFYEAYVKAGEPLPRVDLAWT